MATADRADELVLFGGGAEIAGTAGGADVAPALLGNKAANLVRMARAGLPVPPGFVLPTTLCRGCLEGGDGLPVRVAALLRRGVGALERATGLHFGGDRRPLLLAVRSGGAVSMPGMLDTVLDVGLCDRTLPALVRMSGNPRHAWDSYRRLVQTYAEVVLGRPAEPFDRALAEALRGEDAATVTELDVAVLKDLTRTFLELARAPGGKAFPQDPDAQLTEAVAAVFRSWQGARAVAYRRLHGLDDRAGTAVTVQAMVFGNLGATSGAGVGFTRDPATGAAELYLDYLPNSQGEDVVSGRCPAHGSADVREAFPELYRQLRQVAGQLERLFGDAQDIEFTVQEGRLYLLQARDAKRTAAAALRIACEQVAEGLIDEAAALERLAPLDLAAIRTVRLARADGCRPIGRGIPASPGVAVGEAAFDPARAVTLAREGRSAILVRGDIATADIAGLAAAAGILTARGGRTAHAAVVARQLNKVCIVGCPGLVVQEERACRIGDVPIEPGAALSLDGNSGWVYAGRLEVVAERPVEQLRQVERWKARRADTAARTRV